eukprot:2935977-Rhodomonas_salina.2
MMLMMMTMIDDHHDEQARTWCAAAEAHRCNANLRRRQHRGAWPWPPGRRPCLRSKLRCRAARQTQPPPPPSADPTSEVRIQQVNETKHTHRPRVLNARELSAFEFARARVRPTHLELEALAHVLRDRPLALEHDLWCHSGQTRGTTTVKLAVPQRSTSRNHDTQTQLAVHTTISKAYPASLSQKRTQPLCPKS